MRFPVIEFQMLLFQLRNQLFRHLISICCFCNYPPSRDVFVILEYYIELIAIDLPGGRLNKKEGLTRYGDSHVKDKTS